MTPRDFLEALWPSEGLYALAVPFTIPSTGDRVYSHKIFDTIQDAAAFADARKDRDDIFFALHTLKERRLWNPTKIDRRTGEPGAYEVRVQRNSCAAQCFFFDIDVGPGKGKYADQSEAFRALVDFVTATGLPRPLVTTSGGGLHVYWRIATALASEDWRPHAARLHQLAQHHGLRVDSSRTTDSASVLRVAGTFNRKDPASPREVKVLAKGAATATDALLKQISDATIAAGVAPLAPVPTVAHNVLGSQDPIEFDGPKASLKSLVTACAQIRQMVALKGDISQDAWYFGLLSTVRHVENGDVLVHKVSAGHKQYSPAETDTKVAQLASFGPSSCATIATHSDWGDSLCTDCPFAGRVKNPLMAARLCDTAPPPIVRQTVGDVAVETTIPDPPSPFKRLKGQGVAFQAQNNEGVDASTIICNHDLYPLKRVTNDGAGTEQQVWRVHLPRGVVKDITLDADALYDRKKFASGLANKGVYISGNFLQHVQDYMTAYINELQRLMDAETQSNHLGWTDDLTEFVLPDRILCPSGEVKSASLSVGAMRAAAQVHRKGTLERQVELLRFYRDPRYIPNQYFILCALAAPLFHATGQRGVVINASGDAGASKSTTLYAGASLWGHPELYPINGTNSGATTRGRNERVTTLGNLPICVDEITHLPVKEANDLVMGISQPAHRIRLNQEGVERSTNGGYKATMMLTTSNNSLHGLLAFDNTAGTAGSMRVVEIRFKAQRVHRKYEADDFLAELKENYGHIGEQVMAYVVKNHAAATQRVRAAVRDIDIAVGIEGSERFWSATAVTLVVGEIARELGLLDYDTAGIRNWLISEQIPSMRQVVTSEYSTPLGILADYLETIHGSILIANKPRQGNIPNILKAPSGGQLLAHHEVDSRTMWVLIKGFKDYCQRFGANYSKILQELSQPTTAADGTTDKVIIYPRTRRVLGGGTEYGKAQSWCFAINMAHPDVAGTTPLGVIPGGGSTGAPTGSLRVV